jgi:hypothetical protein
MAEGLESRFQEVAALAAHIGEKHMQVTAGGLAVSEQAQARFLEVTYLLKRCIDAHEEVMIDYNLRTPAQIVSGDQARRAEVNARRAVHGLGELYSL